MNSSHFTTVLRYVRRLAVQDGTSLHSDQQLLARYLTQRDEAAFAALVQRHGSLVWNVCRRVLADPNDADDVFQATFLVLLNKAMSLRGRPSLAGWLQGVAWRLARKVKAQAAHRQEKEARTNVSQSPDDSEIANRRELRSIIDEELLRLPPKYREPVILCYLEGKTYTEAAAYLGWAAGTVSGRLARARTLLGHRLARRGVSLAGAAAVFPELATSSAPAATIAAVEQMARIFLVGRPLAFGSSTTVVGLARWAAQALMFSNFKVVAGLAAFIGILALGAGWTTQLFRHNIAEHASDESQVALDIAEPELIANTATRKDYYGDPLPPGVLARMGSVQFRHPAAAWAFSADGKNLLSVRSDSLYCWDVGTGKLVRNLPVPIAPKETRERVLLSSDGKIAVIVDGTTTRVFDTATMQELRRHPAGLGYITALSGNGKVAAVSAFDGTVLKPMAPQTWDVMTGRQRAQLDKVEGSQGLLYGKIELSSDGKVLAETNAGTIKLWETVEGRHLGAIKVGSNSATLSPDGKTVATAPNDDGTVLLWESATLRQIATLKPSPGLHQDSNYTLSFSGDGAYLAAGGYDTAVVWDLASSKELLRLPIQGDAKLLFTPDNKIVASVGQARARLWDLLTREELHFRPGYEELVTALAISPDGTQIASVGRSTNAVDLWDAATGRALSSISRQKFWLDSTSYSPDGKSLIVSGSHGGLTLLDTATGKSVHQFVNRDILTGDSTMAVAKHLSKDGKRLAVVSRCWNEKPEAPRRVYHQLTVWDVATGKQTVQRQFDPDEYNVAFSPCGLTVAGLAKGRLKVEETLTGRDLVNVPGNLGEPFALSPVGYLAACGIHRTNPQDPTKGLQYRGLGIVELATGEELCHLDAYPWHVAFSSDGRTLVTASRTHLEAWDPILGAKLFEMPWPDDLLSKNPGATAGSLAVTADGKIAVTGMHDGTILVWDLKPAKAPANWSRSKKLERAELESLWADLAMDARTAQPSVHLLAAAPNQAVPFLVERLRPVAIVDTQEVARLIKDLTSEEFATRELAIRTLSRLGAQIEPELTKAFAAKPAREVRAKLEACLQAAHAPCTGETRRTVRAIQVLAMIGTPAARQILQKVATGAQDALETRMAREAIAGFSP